MKIKIFLKVLLVLSLLLTNSKTILANENKSLLDYSTEEILTMSEDIYYNLLSSYLIESIELKKDHHTMKFELATIGIDFDGYVESDQNITRSQTTDIALSAYSSRRSGQSFTYLTGVARSQAVLVAPGTEDMMSIEWYPSKGNYYSYSETHNVTLKDYNNVTQGCITFNVQDVNMQGINMYALASVLVTFSNNNDRGRIGVTYIHTYTAFSPTLTIGGNVSYVNNNLTGGLSINCTISTSSAFWQRSILTDVNA